MNVESTIHHCIYFLSGKQKFRNKLLSIPPDSKLEYIYDSEVGDRLQIYAPTYQNETVNEKTEFILKFLQTSFENKHSTQQPELRWRTIVSKGAPVWSIKIQNSTKFPILVAYYSVAFNTSAVTRPSQLSYFYAQR